MKIVRIIARLNIGGPAIHTVLLSSELNKTSLYKDILVCGKVKDCEGDMSYLAAEKGLTPIIVPQLGRDISLYGDFLAFLKIYSILRREKPDIVHTHTAKAGALGRLAALCAGVPIRIHTFHGHVFDGYFSPIKAKAFLWIEKFLAFFTDRLITVSEKVRDEIVDKLKVAAGSKCVVVPLGFELQKFLECEKRKGSFRKDIGVDEKTLLVGIVGRLVPIKNHVMFIDIAKEVLDKKIIPKIKFVIIGDGELRSFLESRSKELGIEKDIIFTGWERDLSSVYADLDVVALTSFNEGTPVSIIEAMASGKPVIATSVGGVADIVEDGKNGFLVKSNDRHEFSEKLIRLLQNEGEKVSFGKVGRERVRHKYSKDRLVKDIESLYEECGKERSKK